MKKTITAVLLGFCVSVNLFAFIGKSKETEEKKTPKKFEMPQWVRRFDFDLEMRDHNKPKWFLETVQPLYRTPDTQKHTLFFQGRAAHKDSDETFNMGLGYRHLLSDETWLWGVNGFYDITRRHVHQRMSVGAELFNAYTTFRANVYRALSNAKPVKNEKTQKVLNGWDAEGEIPFPFLPWLRFAGQYYKWKGNAAKDKKGYRLRLTADLTEIVSMDLGITHDHYRTNKYAILKIHLGRPTSIQYTFFRNPAKNKIFPSRSVKALTLIKVRRENSIILEEGSSSSGNGIIVKRGT